MAGNKLVIGYDGLLDQFPGQFDIAVENVAKLPGNVGDATAAIFFELVPSYYILLGCNFLRLFVSFQFLNRIGQNLPESNLHFLRLQSHTSNQSIGKFALYMTN